MNAQLLFGDCLDKIKDISDGTVDMIVMDPPYNIGYADWDIFQNVEGVSAECYRVLKDNGSFFCFTGWSFVCELTRRIHNEFKLNDWIIYDRIKGRGAKSRLVSTREDLLWYVKSDKWVFNKECAYSTIKKKTGGMGAKNGKETRALSNVWTDISPIVPWSKEKTSHPTQKPVQLIERILQVFSKENAVILDCYMGSGTTGVACKNLNRRFIGIENNQDYFELAKERIENSTL